MSTITQKNGYPYQFPQRRCRDSVRIPPLTFAAASLNHLSLNSVMGATGAGKSSVRTIFHNPCWDSLPRMPFSVHQAPHRRYKRQNRPRPRFRVYRYPNHSHMRSRQWSQGHYCRYTWFWWFTWLQCLRYGYPEKDCRVLTPGVRLSFGIQSFLTCTNGNLQRYDQTRKLSGLIYVQRISDPRFSGLSSRNLRMFRKLCGTENFQNVVVLTTYWDQLPTWEVGDQREQQLKSKFFARLVEGGAQFMRHDRTVESTRKVLRHIMIMSMPLTTIQIQTEIREELERKPEELEWKPKEFKRERLRRERPSEERVVLVNFIGKPVFGIGSFS